MRFARAHPISCCCRRSFRHPKRPSSSRPCAGSRAAGSSKHSRRRSSPRSRNPRRPRADGSLWDPVRIGTRPDRADEARLFAERLTWSLDRAREQQDAAEPFETGEETLASEEEAPESAVIAGPVEDAAEAPQILVQPDSESLLAVVRALEALAPPVAPVERRLHPRIHGPFDGRRCGLIDIPILIRDISQGGCFVHSVHEAEVGGRLTLAIDVPGGDLVAVEGQVVSCHSPVGFGVRFVDMPEDASARLARLIAKRLANG